MNMFCSIGDSTSLGSESLRFHQSLFHHLGANSKRKFILTKTEYSNCSLVPSDIEGSIFSIIDGPCEELVSQADSFLCYTQAFSIDSEVCLPGHYQCESGTCILNAYRCDGVSHCDDNSDEINCTNVCYILEHGWVGESGL